MRDRILFPLQVILVLASQMTGCHKSAQKSDSSTQPDSNTVSRPAKPAGSGWQTDWSEFQDAMIKGSSDPAFVGKEVTWAGTVTELQAPRSTTQPASVEIKMKHPLAIVRPYEDTETKKVEYMVLGQMDKVTLGPKEKQWRTWENVKSGQAVVFKTRLAKARILGLSFPGVIGVMDLGGTNRSDGLVVLGTEGGEYLHDQ